ncbi:MAG: ribulose 1,5-bisphosphate carboxylase, partial [Candidatus Diapherotrites archaeon]|nr:ribulose 1,5-bisphosphate carboxylase [Candidatus Diapherotrites archaeon]
RIPAVMDALDNARAETGKTVLYAANITTGGYEILSVADHAKDLGANSLMVDAITTGFSAVQALAQDATLKLPIHVHRAMHAAFTRNPKHGIRMLVLAKLDRLAGGDLIHTGTANGKNYEKPTEVKEINEFLTGYFFNKEEVLPISAGGLHPALVPGNLLELGNDLMLQAGGGVHAHPKGTQAGTKAMTQAITAALEGKNLREYAKNHKELKEALDKWSSVSHYNL